MSARDRGCAMKKHWLRSVAIVMTVGALVFAPGAAAVWAQSNPEQAPGAWTSPRMPWGDPDLQGQ